jgi:hypothetical protein
MRWVKIEFTYHRGFLKNKIDMIIWKIIHVTSHTNQLDMS